MPQSAYKGWATAGDLRRLAVLSVGGVTSAFVPRSLEPWVVDRLVDLAGRTGVKERRRVAAIMRRTLPPAVAAEAEQHAADQSRMRIEDMWGRVSGMRRFGWKPETSIEGLEYLDAALARGRGAVLWCMRFSSATALKQAFHQEGRPVAHLSRVTHGSPSESRLGVRVVGPLYCRAENPYLSERIRIPIDGTLGYMKQLSTELKANHVVSIFGEHAGRSNVRASVLGVEREFAVGAPSIAWKGGSGLLFCYPLRTGRCSYRIVIEPELVVDRSMDRKEFATRAAERFAKRLEELIIEHPADWQGWSYQRF